MHTQYTKNVSIILLLISLLVPFFLAFQVVSEDTVYYMIFAATWGLFWYEPEFAFVPLFGLFYFPFWGLGTYIAKIAYDSIKNENLTKFEYQKKVATVFIIQTCILIFLSSFIISGDPPPSTIPLPFVGIIALILSGITVKDPTSPFKEEEVDTWLET